MIADVARHLREMLPTGVASEVFPSHAADPALHPEEEHAVRKAVAKRRSEFARGRAAARAALAAVGAPAGPIGVGDRRQPVWPEGFVGSITHCEGLAAASAASRSLVRAIGIDAEPATPLSANLLHLIATPGERAALGSDLLLAKVAFSAKESVYKAIFPAFGAPLGFRDVEIAFDAPVEGAAPAAFRVHAAPGNERAAPDLERLRGHWAVVAGFVLTTAFLPPA